MKWDANAAAFIAVQAGCCPLVQDVPGMGKTALWNTFAKKAGRRCYTLLGSIREPADIAGIPYPVTHAVGEVEAAIGERQQSFTTIAQPDVVVTDPVSGRAVRVEIQLVAPRWAVNTHNGDKWLIFLDELTTCPPAVQAAMLRVIAERVVGDMPLPEDTWLAAACNPTSIAANGFALEPPMANRLVHLDWHFPWDSYIDGLKDNLNFPEPDFPILPDDWRQEIPRVANLVAAFCHAHRQHFTLQLDNNGIPKGGRESLSGAYPSPRSWHYAVLCMAAARSINAPANIENDLLAGCVGEGVQLVYREWVDNLDLPDPEDVLAWAASLATKKPKSYPGSSSKDWQHPDRADKLIALLGAVSDRVVGNMADTDRFNEERYLAMEQVFLAAAKHQKDVALTCMAYPVKKLRDAQKVQWMTQQFQDYAFQIFQRTREPNRAGA